jgi:hypothetical protein
LTEVSRAGAAFMVPDGESIANVPVFARAFSQGLLSGIPVAIEPELGLLSGKNVPRRVQ